MCTIIYLFIFLYIKHIIKFKFISLLKDKFKEIIGVRRHSLPVNFSKPNENVFRKHY